MIGVRSFVRELVGRDSKTWRSAREACYRALLIGGAGVVGRIRQRGGILILTTHSFTASAEPGLFGEQPIRTFARQIRYLTERYDVVPLEMAAAQMEEHRRAVGRAGRPLAVLTVDDGFGNNFDLLKPVLEAARVPAAFFLTTGFLDEGKPPWPVEVAALLRQTHLDALTFPLAMPIGNAQEKAVATMAIKQAWKASPPSERRDQLDELQRHLRVASPKLPPPLQWNQVRELRDGGHSIGAHTVHHSILPLMPDGVVRDELSLSKARIEAELGRECRALAYPNGDWDERTAGLAEAAGFSLALTQDHGINWYSTPRLALKRLNLPPSDGLGAFAGRIALVNTQ